MKETNVIRHEHGWLEWRYAPGLAVEIVNIEVSNLHRREGVGRWMVNRLLSEVLAKGDTIASVYLFTHESNKLAHDFYRGMGFHRAATLERFYVGNNPDAVMFVLTPPIKNS